MTSAKKRRGRASKQERAERRGAHPERFAPSRRPDHLHPRYELGFVPIRLTRELRQLEGVDIMLEGVRDGCLQSWELGRKGTHISSRFVTDEGLEDTLTSPNPDDDDYDSLVQAHILRLAKIMGRA
jgi:hypothetical protein